MSLPSFEIEKLGRCTIKSPLKVPYFVRDEERIVYNPELDFILQYQNDLKNIPSFEKAGPREMIYFEPSKVRAAIVTCGGLCPGINDVIRALVMELFYAYGVKRIYGIQFGYRGLNPEYGLDFIELTPDVVSEIHTMGGSILGSSRGDQPIDVMVDSLERMNVNVLFAIGGDGTLKGAHDIWKEIKNRNLKISVIGIPKTIDNDISYVDKTFGFETAFSIACNAISTAHTEAKGYHNGVGIVKLMGRDSGYIAATATLAMSYVNFVLVPEVEFDMEGENGFLRVLKKRLIAKNHAVIVVAEGAGQHIFREKVKNQQKDASGNLRLIDIGIYIKNQIKEFFKREKMEVNLKYIDPSYLIRSVPANASDSMYCIQLAQIAVHAAMSGKTDMLVGIWNDQFTHVPLEAATSKRKVIDLNSSLWLNVLEATGQPPFFK